MFHLTLSAKAWKFISLGCITTACVFALVALVGSRRAILLMYWGRYTAYLLRGFKRLHRRHNPTQVAVVQVGMLLLVAVLATMRVLPAWYVAAFGVALAPAIWLENQWKKRVAKLEEQANSFALALSNTLKATPNVGAALQTVSSLLEGPVAEEFQVASKEARLGRQMDEALRELGQRCGSTKLNTVLAAILIGRQVGGNLPRILETTAATLRELERLEGVLRQKTSDARMQMWGLTLAPFVLCWGIHKLDPNFFRPLMDTQSGHVLVGVAMGCYVASLVAARKIMQVDI